MPLPTLQQCAFPAVTSLICFLAYPSQWLLLRLDPQPLTRQQLLILNTYALVILFCYYKACFTDPGRIPPDWLSDPDDNGQKDKKDQVALDSPEQYRQRWCRKCQAFKPPRAHHCKTCGRCIPKMDHHCPWTANCVSHVTFPHFIRFLLWAVIGMTHLECIFASRMQLLWTQRHLPSYLGPSTTDLFFLLLLTALNSFVVFALFVLLVRTVWCLGANTTTIEGWEIERHEALLRRARTLGGYLNAPNGIRMRITRQEYPWDIGIYANISQGMGSRNPISWLWPFSKTPSVESGLQFEENGIEAPGTSWPPPDPDRMFRVDHHFNRNFDASKAFTKSLDPEEFRKRQQADQHRYPNLPDTSEFRRRQPFHVRYDPESAQKPDQDVEAIDNDYNESESEEESTWKPEPGEGEEGWRNSEGERLNDFGVDEDVEFYDEDNIPLAELLRRRKQAAEVGTDM